MKDGFGVKIDGAGFAKEGIGLGKSEGWDG